MEKKKNKTLIDLRMVSVIALAKFDSFHLISKNLRYLTM